MREMSEAGSALKIELVVVCAVLALATVYDAAIALQVVDLGRQSGQAPVGSNYVLLAALLAMLVVAATLPVAAASREVIRGLASSPLVPLVGLGAAAFVLAHSLSYDPYYLPTLRRMSDGGIIPPWWVALVVLLTTGAAALARLHARAGLLAMSCAMVVGAVTALLMGLGH